MIKLFKKFKNKTTLDELISLFNNYKKLYQEDYNIASLNDKIKEEIGSDLYDKLNINQFLKALGVRNSIDIKSSLELFDNYISSLPRRYRKIFYKDESNYELEELEKLKKLKDKIRKKESYDIFHKENKALFTELTKMVLWVKKTGSKVLITCDGRDTGGKGSFIKYMLWNYIASPLANTIFYKAFGIPTKYEQENWFDRYEKVLPIQGQIVLFDRSWYNRAVNDIIMGYCTEEQYNQFMEDVIPFEQSLKDKGIIHIKFWFSIDKETQQSRFEIRQANPIKFWKFSPNDLKAAEKWDYFTRFKNIMFDKTSTDDFPWVVVNMNDKPIGWMNGLRYVLNKVPYENKNEKILDVYPEVVYEI